ncbi:ABC transporter permease [Pontibacter anaerobius]|uniref:ABC transporter permease n=1 Tax=Pontibacter anaerobius TaxID=2993940 RepID=A0ABT3RJI4_9BACT|nr:ABC transporter permease [Pontibacter anaerobius]MCX2741534.1 ABC transporter permease [Pontibacter anaerobius]
MNALIYYRSSVSSESLKLKNTFSLWLSILAPCALIGMHVLVFWSKGQHFITEGVNPWHRFAMQNFSLYTILLMPIFIALLTSLTNGIEHKSNGWKHLNSLPLPKSTIYTAKATTVVGLVLLSNVVFVLAYLAAGLFLQLVRPDLGFENIVGLQVVFVAVLKMFLATFVIIAVQFWLSIRWSSFALSMGVGIVAIITVIVATQWEYIHLYPFAYPLMSIKNFPSEAEVYNLFSQEVLLSLGVGLLVFILGYFDVSRKRIS